MGGRFITGIAFSSLLLGASAAMSGTAWGVNPADEETATVVIQGRRFTPDRTILQLGRKTRLVFINRDAELHAVVPAGLFAGESLNIAGNGAPEFGPDGFKRVVIPPEGIVEIRFAPSRPGEHQYFCDMPGHEMKAVLVVE
jgi:plastocyanin